MGTSAANAIGAVLACPSDQVTVGACDESGSCALTCSGELMLMELEPSSSLGLPELSADDALEIASAIALLWAVAWVWKSLRR